MTILIVDDNCTNRKLLQAVFEAEHFRTDEAPDGKIEVQEAEQRHLAGELHDELGQNLGSPDLTGGSAAQTRLERVNLNRLWSSGFAAGLLSLKVC